MREACMHGVRRRRGRLRLILYASLAACGFMLAAAAGGVTASAVADVVSTMSSSATTPALPTTTGITSASTTAAQTTTTAATTTEVVTTTQAVPTTAAVASAAVTHRAFAHGCPVSAAALEIPGQLPSLLGPMATAPGDTAMLNVLRYPASGSVFDAADVDVSGGGCEGAAPAGHISIRSVSVFGKALSADAITLTVGEHETRLMNGLRVGGVRASTASKGWHPLQRWGEWKLGGVGSAVAALTVRLMRTRAGLPAGTVLLVATAGSAAQPRRSTTAAKVRRPAGGGRRRPSGRPLDITPPLAVGGEVFPVVGARASFSDTYGASRSDVAGGWHHGDDIFAPLGTPVVAVADGTINRVGWNEVGGWRLWVRDGGGDEFYYAHLSGYTRNDLHSKHVRAGEVIGFVGNTGDAITTPAHLHFEIHPRTLLHLAYNGAVDPTSYLDHWRRIRSVNAPKPAHPTLPSPPTLRQEALHVWRELLSARHLEQHPALTGIRSFPLPLAAFRNRILALPAPEAASTGAVAHRPRHSAAAPLLLVVLGLAIALALAAAQLRPRRNDA